MLARLLLIATCFVGLLTPLRQSAVAAPASPAPAVASVRGRSVTVRVPPGFSSVTLRQRTGVKNFPWKMLGSRDVDPAGGNVKFTLRSAVAPRALAVDGTRAIVPARLSAVGLQRFGPDPAVAGGPNVRLDSGVVGATSGTTLTLSNTTTPKVSSDGASPSRSVVESDIWRVAGDRLYFFNQLRGLQVFDISDADDPTLLGQLREPNRGEQMYQLDATHVALLTRPSYYFGIYLDAISLASPSLDQGSGAIVIADTSAAQPREIARIPYAGYLVESRLVGSALYVVSETYTASNSGLTVTSFDLSDPVHPQKVATLDLGSYGGVVSATDRFLFVVRYSGDWRRSNVELVDISDPNGALVRRGTITTAGIVDDKFKLHLEGNRLTVVSNVRREWAWDWGTGAGTASAPSRTAVENFNLANPAAPVALGSIDVGIGETVRATRFADGRLYVVTFFTIDPLWVIDYSTAKPTLLGELEVPGFSNYIEPLGDRLVAVGRINQQTAVSLFDVSDPTKPKSLAQLPIGDGYSYSQANWDEKAFGVFPGANLIVVPYSGYDSSSGWANRVQLIDLQRDSLNARGILNHALAARRSAVVGNRLLTISSSNLVSVDFADRDHPRVTSDVEIAWRVDRTFLVGSHLVQIGGASGWSTATEPPRIAISPADSPDAILTELALPDAQVIGATVRGNRLYVAQQTNRSWWGGGPVLLAVSATGTGSTTPTPATRPLIVSVFDLSNLPAITLLGKTETDTDAGGNNLEAAWPAPGTLVWVRPQSYSWWWRGGPIAYATDIVAPARAVVAANSLVYPGWGWNAASHELFIYDVSNPAAPRFTKGLDVRTGSSGDWSAPITSGGKLYLSSFVYGDSDPARSNRHFLKTVDFTDPANPSVSAEVNLPGRLLAVANAGATLLTVGCNYEPDGTGDDRRAFHSSHFDGSAATLVDQLETSTSYPAFVVESGNLFVMNAAPAEIQGWKIGVDEKLSLAGKITTSSFHTLAAVRGLLIGLGNGLPRLFDVRDPVNPAAVSADTRELTGYDFSTTAGGAGLGLWQPLGDTGVGVVELP